MKSIICNVFFVIVCLAGILSGFYAYLGATGTRRCRADAIARGEFLSNPSFPHERHYLTGPGLEGIPKDVAEQYEDAARAGYVLATQGNCDKLVMFGQSFLLLTAGVTGLIARRPSEADDEG